MANKKKELKKAYKDNPTPMGVYQIRNIVNDKVFVGTALNLPGILNSQKFQLSHGGHPNKSLQAEWDEFGGESFTFDVLDELSPMGAPGQDYREELAFLEEFWLEKLQPYGERGYNEIKKNKDEKLRLIAQGRLSKQ